ncbi:helix-turn-helix transcriptional regulator [Bifidobacterium sp. UTBIF-68]|uniref:helix-turn-helix transcriptional regulator n=1 Tax=Bifidobacterium sp. UTBIF-68 TaxID=1465262 RepID=UPI001128A59E
MGLKQLRERAGLTQVKLSQQTGIARTVISSYETGRRDERNMTLENALRLSRALGCRPDELTDGYPE